MFRARLEFMKATLRSAAAASLRIPAISSILINIKKGMRVDFARRFAQGCPRT